MSKVSSAVPLFTSGNRTPLSHSILHAFSFPRHPVAFRSPLQFLDLFPLSLLRVSPAFFHSGIFHNLKPWQFLQSRNVSMMCMSRYNSYRSLKRLVLEDHEKRKYIQARYFKNRKYRLVYKDSFETNSFCSIITAAIVHLLAFCSHHTPIHSSKLYRVTLNNHLKDITYY